MSAKTTTRENRSHPAAAPAVRASRRRGIGRPPLPLLALLIAVTLLGVAWALVVPAFQAPDENSHFAYLQSLAERGDLPGDAGRNYRSTEQELASDAVNSDQTAQQLGTKSEWSKRAYDRWRDQADALSTPVRKDGGGVNPASSNPPLYYLSEVPAYKLADGGDLFSRVTAARLGSLPFLLTTVIATWLLAGEVFGPNRVLQLASAAVPGLLPMMTFISSSVTPDSLLFALWSLALWLGARILRKGGGVLEIAVLLGVTGLAVATKATSYALLPAVVLVLGGTVWRTRRVPRKAIMVVAAGVVAFAIAAGGWYVVARLNDRPAAAQITEGTRPADFNEREFVGYVWQFYLPRLPFLEHYGPIDWPVTPYEIWVKQSWGAFGWLEVRWPRQVYWVFALVTAVVAAGALVAILRRRRTVNLLLLAFFATVLASLLAGLHWNEYRIAEVDGALVNQGRYLFPTIGLAGLALGAALTVLPVRARPPALGAVLGALATLQLFSLGLVASRFYA
jgi:4-amino-4-deoxy-L-arabinose transferase-like glycosyltransferase